MIMQVAQPVVPAQGELNRVRGECRSRYDQETLGSRLRASDGTLQPEYPQRVATANLVPGQRRQGIDAPDGTGHVAYGMRVIGTVEDVGVTHDLPGERQRFVRKQYRVHVDLGQIFGRMFEIGRASCRERVCYPV